MQPQHGGPRKGAGRPKLANPKRHIAVRIDAKVWQFLKAQDNTSQAVEQIIRQSRKFKTWKQQ